MRVVFVRASPGNRRQCTRPARTLGVILTAAVSAVQDADFGNATLWLQIHSPPWVRHRFYRPRKKHTSHQKFAGWILNLIIMKTLKYMHSCTMCILQFTKKPNPQEPILVIAINRASSLRLKYTNLTCVRARSNFKHKFYEINEIHESVYSI